jgi:hypothetical protein
MTTNPSTRSAVSNWSVHPVLCKSTVVARLFEFERIPALKHARRACLVPLRYWVDAIVDRWNWKRGCTRGWIITGLRPSAFPLLFTRGSRPGSISRSPPFSLSCFAQRC